MPFSCDKWHDNYEKVILLWRFPEIMISESNILAMLRNYECTENIFSTIDIVRFEVNVL